MADTPSFTQMVPGFEFLQNLVKNAGSAMPPMGQWIAPTLNPEEIEKRISELRTVQFWLEQNARMIAATIQALEVQRMTLSTLQTMNVQMGDLRDSLQARATPKSATPPAAAEDEPDLKKPGVKDGTAPDTDTDADTGASTGTGTGTGTAPIVDPMQWWGSLTKQFTQLAASAMKEPPATPQGEPAATPPRKKPAARKTAARPRRAAPKP